VAAAGSASAQEKKKVSGGKDPKQISMFPLCCRLGRVGQGGVRYGVGGCMSCGVTEFVQRRGWVYRGGFEARRHAIFSSVCPRG
jgi:hypothetical protein